MLVPSLLDPARAAYRRTVPSGDYWIHRVGRGETFRMVDVGGNQAADTLFYNAADPTERYSATDTLGGCCAGESNTVRYGHETRAMHCCRDSFLLAVATHEEYGLNKRDIAHNINFFMNVPVTQAGNLTFEDGVSGPGQYVEMRAEMDVIVLISACPQLNNPCNDYNPTPLEMIVWAADPA